MDARLAFAALAACLTGYVMAATQDRGGGADLPYDAPSEPTAPNVLDGAVFDALRRKGIEPARACSDAVFVRRVYLDVIGTLPSMQETKKFLDGRAPNKRSALIDELLSREAHADYWSMKWCDVLRVKAEFPINLWPNAVQAYHRWIRDCVRDNMPYDRFARQLLTDSGSNFREAPVNFYRALQSKDPATLAHGVALTFMGERTENWASNRLAGMAAFFAEVGFKGTAEWKEEIVFHDLAKAAVTATNGVRRSARFPDGKPARLAEGVDPRVVFADWLIADDNPWFARTVVNRIWFWLLGRGIVHEPDDFRPDNPPSNPELLATLEREFVKSRYDMKQLCRLIVNSRTYQRSPVPRTADPAGEANFAYYPLRRLDAEVLADALCQITGTTESYQSAIPEPFSFIPDRQRSIALADGSITSPFLEMFGRPPRDTGLVAERNARPTAEQRLHILNSSHILKKIEQGARIKPLLQIPARNPRTAVETIYLTVLSRYPTREEEAVVSDGDEQRAGGGSPRERAIDLVWALVNSPEFLYQH